MSTSEKPKITSSKILATAHQIWRTNLRQQLHISLIWLILPQFAIYLISSQLAQTTTHAMWDLTSQNYTGTPDLSGGLLGLLQGFLAPFAMFWLLSLLSFCVGYTTLTKSNLRTLKEEPPIPHSDITKNSIKDAAKILGLAVLIQATFILGMQLALFHIVALILCSVSPILLLEARKGIWKSFWESLTMKYADKSRQGAVSLFFALGSASAIIYLSSQIIFHLNSKIPVLDMSLGFSRSIFVGMTIMGLPLFKVISGLISSILLAVVFSWVSCVTIAFYSLARKRINYYL